MNDFDRGRGEVRTVHSQGMDSAVSRHIRETWETRMLGEVMSDQICRLPKLRCKLKMWARISGGRDDMVISLQNEAPSSPDNRFIDDIRRCTELAVETAVYSL